MDARQLRRLKPELELFLDRYAPAFGHPGNALHARQFVHGLLLGGDRRSVENIAEAVEGGVVRSLQKFLGQGAWDGEEVLKELRRHVVDEIGAPDAILNVDETGFPKKGKKSVGVKRQYAGCLGRTDNCQIGVFLNYTSKGGHTLIDRRIYLPEEWTGDLPRRREAGVPDGVVFRTKPELALEMVREFHAAGAPFQWVTGDSVYGDSPTFVQGVREIRKFYVADVSSEARVWLEEPVLIPAGTKRGRGRPTLRDKPASKPISVKEAAAAVPASAWRRITVAEGSQGPRVFEYAAVWVWFSEEGLPSGRERLLCRRSLNQNGDLKFHRSNAPASIGLERLAEVRGQHWRVEQGFQSAKGECGLDEYETRGWTGWRHHTALSLLALWFLTLQTRRLGEKKRDSAPDGFGTAGTARTLA